MKITIEGVAKMAGIVVRFGETGTVEIDAIPMPVRVLNPREAHELRTVEQMIAHGHWREPPS